MFRGHPVFVWLISALEQEERELLDNPPQYVENRGGLQRDMSRWPYSRGRRCTPLLAVGPGLTRSVHLNILGVRLSPYQRYRYSLSSGTQGAGAVRYRPSSGTGGAGTGRVTVLGVLGALRY